METPSRHGPRSIAVGESLPALSFRRMGGTGKISWSQGPMASVVFVPHRSRCQACADYIVQLSSAAGDLRDWATRPMVVVATEEAEALPAAADRPGVLIATDDEGAGRARLGIGEDQAIVVQADRWGAVYGVEKVGSIGGRHSDLPGPEDLVALAKFIDIQCPECGVPSKEWLGASPFPLG